MQIEALKPLSQSLGQIVSSGNFAEARPTVQSQEIPAKAQSRPEAVWENVSMTTSQQTLEWHTATCVDEEGRVWHFASVDGERWTGLEELPEEPMREYVDQLADYLAGTDRLVPMTAATRWLRQYPSCTFHLVVTFDE